MCNLSLSSQVILLFGTEEADSVLASQRHSTRKADGKDVDTLRRISQYVWLDVVNKSKTAKEKVGCVIRALGDKLLCSETCF